MDLNLSLLFKNELSLPSRNFIRKVKGGLGDDLYGQIKELIETDKNDAEELRTKIISYLIRLDRREQRGILALRWADTILL